VYKLRGVRYKWRREKFPQKNFPEGWQLGFIAQEVEQVVPEVVNTAAARKVSIRGDVNNKHQEVGTKGMRAGQQGTEEEEEGFKSVQYGALVPVVVEALKEADTRARQTEGALRVRVEKLEADNAMLVSRLAQLEKMVSKLIQSNDNNKGGDTQPMTENA
jgi:hypothetical protein